MKDYIICKVCKKKVEWKNPCSDFFNDAYNLGVCLADVVPYMLQLAA